MHNKVIFALANTGILRIATMIVVTAAGLLGIAGAATIFGAATLRVESASPALPAAMPTDFSSRGMGGGGRGMGGGRRMGGGRGLGGRRAGGHRLGGHRLGGHRLGGRPHLGRRHGGGMRTVRPMRNMGYSLWRSARHNMNPPLRGSGTTTVHPPGAVYIPRGRIYPNSMPPAAPSTTTVVTHDPRRPPPRLPYVRRPPPPPTVVYGPPPVVVTPPPPQVVMRNPPPRVYADQMPSENPPENPPEEKPPYEPPPKCKSTVIWNYGSAPDSGSDVRATANVLGTTVTWNPNRDKFAETIKNNDVIVIFGHTTAPDLEQSLQLNSFITADDDQTVSTGFVQTTMAGRSPKLVVNAGCKTSLFGWKDAFNAQTYVGFNDDVPVGASFKGVHEAMRQWVKEGKSIDDAFRYGLEDARRKAQREYSESNIFTKMACAPHAYVQDMNFIEMQNRVRVTGNPTITYKQSCK
jgi:hypothetical protein